MCIDSWKMENSDPPNSSHNSSSEDPVDTNTGEDPVNTDTGGDPVNTDTGGDPVNTHNNGNGAKVKCGQTGCNYQSRRVKELTPHLKSIHNIDKYIKCKQCPLEFSGDYKTYTHHVRKHCKMEDVMKARGFRCSICAAAKKTWTQLSKHMLKLHRCSYTILKTPTPTIQRDGWMTIPLVTKDGQEIPEVGLGTNESFPCTECRRAFISEHELSHHRENACRTRYPCPNCTEKYANKVKLSRHQRRTHNVEITFKCDVCRKSCASDRAMYAHILAKHWTAEKPKGKRKMKCSMCDYAIGGEDKLARHMVLGHEAEYEQLSVPVKTTDDCFTIKVLTDAERETWIASLTQIQSIDVMEY